MHLKSTPVYRGFRGQMGIQTLFLNGGRFCPTDGALRLLSALTFIQGSFNAVF